MTNRHERLRARALERRPLTPTVASLLARHAAWVHNQMLSDNYSDNRTLYHFTTLEALRHILSERRFRLTGLGDLRANDRGEVEFGLRAMAAAVRDYKMAARPTPLTARQLHFLAEVERFLTLETFGELFDFHIVCFAPHAEDHDMWNSDYAAHGAGVALGVTYDFFRSGPYVPLGQAERRTFVIQRATYGAPKVADQTRKLLDVALRVIGKASVLSTRESDLRKVETETFAQFFIQAVAVAMVAKEEKFQREMEVRGISFARRDSSLERARYNYEPLGAEMIGSICYGPTCDLPALRSIVAEAGLSQSLLVPANVII